MKGRARFWNGYDKVIDALMWIVGGLMAADVVVVSADVLMRYVFSVTHPWLFELTEYSLLWMTFLGAAWVMRHEGHVRMELVVSRLKPHQAHRVRIIGTLISLVVLAIAIWFSLQVTVRDFGQVTRLPSVIRPLKGPIEAVIPVGFALLMIEVLRKGCRRPEP